MTDEPKVKTKLGAPPCNGCTHCCRELVVLWPEDGDDPSLYQTVEIHHPQTNKTELALARRPNGTCVHLDEANNMCGVYDHRPKACSAFDCRLVFWHVIDFFKVPLRTQRQFSAHTRKVIRMGKDRIDTLDATWAERMLYKNNLHVAESHKVHKVGKKRGPK
jgi:hypothetical protein